MKGTQKFIKSSDAFLERAATLLDNAFENGELDAKLIGEYLDVIYRGMQSIKVMTEKEKKKTTEEDDATNGKSLAERMSKNGNR